MLNETAWRQLCQQLQVSKPAQQIAEEIRSSPPARCVRNTAGNVSVRYPSRKMGVTIQAESHRNELAGIYEKEYDPEVLEYYDQPPRIKLIYQAKHGRRIGIWHTPDYFVIRTDSLGWEEWKMEADLLRLAEQMPNRYVHADGRWRCPPGEAHAEPFGFFYLVRSSAEIDWVLQRNLVFLEDYLRAEPLASEEMPGGAVVTRVAEQPGITLHDLLSAQGAVPRDVVYALIACGQLYVDLQAAPLAEPHRVHVFRDIALAQGYTVLAENTPRAPEGHPPFVEVGVGVSVLWDGRPWTIVNLGSTQTTLLAQDGLLIDLPAQTFESLIQAGKLVNPQGQEPFSIPAEVQELLSRASPADFAEANRRYALIAPRLNGQPLLEPSVSARTLREWALRWREAEARYRCGYVGLLPQSQARGNRQRKLPDSTVEALETFIRNDYETLKQKPKSSVYGALVRSCEVQGLAVPSYKTFLQAVNRRPRATQIQKRQGSRAAYPHEPFYRELTLTTPRHGDRPFEIGHIDHTQLDLELVCSRTGRPLGRPWATFLSDAFSRSLLAVALSFDPPSYRACLLILRECVQRHQRLPYIVVVDGGREFASVYFETLLARYESLKKTRPGAKPRFGSVCERLFGTTNTRFIHNLLGNTQMMRHVRQVTKAVTPEAQACWTLGSLHGRLCEWAYDIYATIEHPALGQSPREAFEQGILESGQRTQRMIPYDDTFRLMTFPTTCKGTAKVLPNVGVQIHGLYYWAEAFLDPEVEQTQVPVRYDPFDAGVAFAFVKGRWVQGFSEHYAHFAGRSEREIQLATVELRKRHQRHGQQFRLTARKLADFLASLEAEELLLEQRLQDAEARAMFTTPDTASAGLSQVAVSHPSPGGEESPPLGGETVSAGEQGTQPGPESLAEYEDY